MNDRNCVHGPTFWIHNDDGSVTQSGGGMDGVRMTSPGGAIISNRSNNKVPITNSNYTCSSQVAKHVVAKGKFMLNVRNGQTVTVTCDYCKTRGVVGTYSLGNVDVCVACAEKL